MPTAPKPLESPIARRSALLAEMLKQGQAQQQIQGGYGELGARLLAQYLTQRASEKTDAALGAETANAALARNQSLAARVGLSIEGTPQEVGNGRLGNPFSGLVAAIRGKPVQPEVMPQAAPQAPVQAAPMPTNTQEPVSSPVAPMAQVEGAPLPQSGQPMAMPQAQAPAPAVATPQAAPNPLGPTEQERALIMQYLNSGDEGMIAAAEKMVQDIELRQAQPAWQRGEYQPQNGVGGFVDPATRQWVPIEGGVPQEAMNQTAVAEEGNTLGLVPGTTYTVSPQGAVTIVDRPSPGYVREGGRLRPEAGGPQDPAANGNMITNERELRTEFERATTEYRTVRQAAAKVEASLAQGTGIGDVGGIFGVMKMFDPTSTVREGEFATAQNSAGVPDYVRNLYNQAANGQRLTPQQRQDMINVSRAQLATYEESYASRVDDFTRMAGQYGLNPENVVGTRQRQTRPQQRQNPPTQPRQPTRAELEAEARRRGLL